MRNRLEVSQISRHFQELGQLQVDVAKRPIRRRKQVPICFCGPERYEQRYQYPVIVWLHSCHSNETEIGNVMPVLSLQNYVACAPRAPIAGEANGQRFLWGQSRAAIAIAEESVFAAIEAAQERFSISRERVFLAGFGSGATMAWRIALRYPTEFAGVVAACGKFPQQHVPLVNYNCLSQVPTLWMYGADSSACGVDHVCQSLPIMHAARLSVDIRQYPCRDELLSNMLSDANSWMMGLVTKQSSPSVEQSCETSFSNN